MIDTKSKVCLQNSEDRTRQIWLDLPFDEDELNSALQSIGVAPICDSMEFTFDQIASESQPLPRYVVTNWLSTFLKPKHFQNIFAASDLVEEIESLDQYQEDVLNALIADGDSLEEAIQKCEDGDVDFYPNTDLTGLAEQFADEGLFTDEYLLEHVDWEAVGRDLGFDGYKEVAGGVLRRN